MPASRIQQAIFEYRTDPSVSIFTAAIGHDLNPSTFHRIFKRWADANPTADPQTPSDIVVSTRSVGRPRAFSAEEENLIAQLVLSYSDDGSPLTLQLVQQVAEHYLQNYRLDDRLSKFKNGMPSRGWVSQFIARRGDLRKVHMRFIEEQRFRAVTFQKVAEHIARVIAVLKRYRIDEPSRVINIDECGMGFDRMSALSLRRGVAHAQDATCVDISCLRTKGKLNHVTLMAVIAADGKAYKPVVVFPGKQPHYRRLANGSIQTVHDFLPESYVYHRDPAGVDSAIFLSWARKFLRETAHLRTEGRHMAIIFDGYSGHIQLEVLSLLRENRVHAIALPSHTSHVLQPLDVSVFSPFKSALQAEMHKIARHTRVIDVFAASAAITAAYSAAVNHSNIVRGFEKTGIWVRDEGGPSAAPLTELFRRQGKKVTVSELMRSFDKRTRGLVFSADVVQHGTVRIDTSSGVNLTTDAVIGALALREERRRATTAPRGPSPFVRRGLRIRERRRAEDTDDTLQPAREPVRAELNRTRVDRRAIRKRRAQAARQLVN